MQKVVREATTGRRLVDKLVKIWRTDGTETWVLVHIEIQGQVDPDFPARMYLYHYRIYDRGFSRQQILELFRFIDWIMELPQELEDKFEQAIYQFEEVKKMQYITSIERKGIKQGLMEGISLGLELKFGKEGVRELPNIKKIKSLERLRLIFNAIKTVHSLDELRQMYNNQPDKM